MAKQRIDDVADYVIVGTGAGGATAARVLAEAGLDIVLLEEGPEVPLADRRREALDSMSVAVRDMASQTTDGIHPIPLLQGRVVGGSTAINSGIIWRLPDDVRRDWCERFGLERLVDENEMERVFARIEDEIGVHETEGEMLGGNNLLMERGAQALGLPGRRIHRNTKGCQGNGRCLQGCPIGARQSMDVSYIPRAIADGARLHSSCHATRVVFEGRRAVAVRGTVHDPKTRARVGSFEVRARRGVIVAASAIWTPVLLQNSGYRHPLLGERFQAHPGAAFVGRFDEPVQMGFGASQGYEVPMRDRGYKLESLGLPAEMLAARLPGAGAEWSKRLANLGNYVQWGGQVRMEALGRVRARWGGGVSVKYEPTKRDIEKLHDALVLTGRMMLAAGAKEIHPGVAGFPETITTEAELDAFARHPLHRSQAHLVASHLFGTACASRDPKLGVVNDELAAHGAEGLYVMDASVFPTNLGVNPQHSIMGVVWRASEMLAARATGRAAA
ncbi:GMC family oxidoreductase N-terminal domain-containing protein [Sandaracinus amylolyticus]|uniref:GMC family oxidoreductase N-terminal domain-containing protein n=1 Tax=Sandaracinus amylolyticus TaxID=927083 RepID=UPI001F258212|nr:GMC family oxidoreductase [Sandaracinus amylolyticus]UJR80889.1 Choline dehydrogenase [Sandaracinus amylolyticus]